MRLIPLIVGIGKSRGGDYEYLLFTPWGEWVWPTEYVNRGFA